MAGVYDTIRVFALEHKGCGDGEALTPEGYEVWVRSRGGARLDQWISPADAEADLLRPAVVRELAT